MRIFSTDTEMRKNEKILLVAIIITIIATFSCFMFMTVFEKASSMYVLLGTTGVMSLVILLIFLIILACRIDINNKHQ